MVAAKVSWRIIKWSSNLEVIRVMSAMNLE